MSRNGSSERTLRSRSIFDGLTRRIRFHKVLGEPVIHGLSVLLHPEDIEFYHLQAPWKVVRGAVKIMLLDELGYLRDDKDRKMLSAMTEDLREI